MEIKSKNLLNFTKVRKDSNAFGVAGHFPVYYIIIIQFTPHWGFSVTD
jgi:hypothetical protein